MSDLLKTPSANRPPPSSAVNLMETPGRVTKKRAKAEAAWFTEARFGMFVHYGLYSILGREAWAMYFEKIPAVQYNRLAQQFRADKFDAEALAQLAKRAGAKYMVFVARHHDGFCLWNTQTTAFNSVQAPAGRDLVREYVEACRRADLKVGIYYSVMSWQWPAIFSGPETDPEGWRAMVAETHEQVRELMSAYGKIDYLWYDGCVVPGLGDESIRAKLWRSRELNRMVRRLQPEILINDRAGLPEDVTTPEQNLTPAPRGRLWECCQTIGDFWGWNPEDRNLKSVTDLINQLIFCARYGGNFLLNVGLRGSGSVPDEQLERMEAIGRWMSVNGQAIRGSQRTAYTEANHILGAATCHDRTLYFHVSEWPQFPAVVAGIRSKIRSVRLLGSERDLGFEQKADGTAILHGFPDPAPLSAPQVVVLALTRAPAKKSPPSLLLERDTGRHDPAESAVNPISEWQMAERQSLAFDVPATGRYHLELGIVAEKATPIVAMLDDTLIENRLSVECGQYPLAVRMGSLMLGEGRHELKLHANKCMFGLYLWRLQPVWKPIGPKYWSTSGPFPTQFEPEGDLDLLRDTLKTVFPPEKEFDDDLLDAAVNGPEVQWQSHTQPGENVNLGLLCGGKRPGVCYARMVVESSCECDADVLLGCDWWANLYVNGRLTKSGRDPEQFKKDGAWFNGWKPIPARISLRRGRNVILVKCHPGSVDNWFSFYLNDPECLKFENI